MDEQWVEVDLYDMQVISGKDSLRSPEFQRLRGDITTGRVNTILCADVTRLCRNVLEFLQLLKTPEEHKVELVCIKQQLDTTTRHGRLSLTMLMALAQFEREQTAERTSDTMIARSERVLWNGGQLLPSTVWS